MYTADAQTAVRGRLDHRWLSAPGANLMLCSVFDVSGLASERVATFRLVVGTQRVGNSKGQQLYFLDTENCLIFASAEGEDSKRMRGAGVRCDCGIIHAAATSFLFDFYIGILPKTAGGWRSFFVTVKNRF